MRGARVRLGRVGRGSERGEQGVAPPKAPPPAANGIPATAQPPAGCSVPSPAARAAAGWDAGCRMPDAGEGLSSDARVGRRLAFCVLVLNFSDALVLPCVALKWIQELVEGSGPTGVGSDSDPTGLSQGEHVPLRAPPGADGGRPVVLSLRL